MITKVEYINGYRLLCTFFDGQKRLIDLERFFTTTELPVVQDYAIPEKFKSVHIENGTIAWGNNECDINPVAIYLGEYEANDSPYLNDIKRTIDSRKKNQKTTKRQSNNRLTKAIAHLTH